MDVGEQLRVYFKNWSIKLSKNTCNVNYLCIHLSKHGIENKNVKPIYFCDKELPIIVDENTGVISPKLSLISMFENRRCAWKHETNCDFFDEEEARFLELYDHCINNKEFMANIKNKIIGL